MKEPDLSRWLVTLLCAAGAGLGATSAGAAALSLVSSASGWNNTQTGPADTIDQIANYLGYYPHLVGPGGALTGVTFNGTQTQSVAAASSMLNVAWYQVWDYGATQTATQRLYWAAIYSLNGTPGSAADVSLQFTYDNSRLNLAFDGRTESKSSVSLFYDIVDGASTGNYTQDAADALQTYMGFHFPWQPVTAPSAWEYSPLGSRSYDANYHFAAVSSSDDSESGVFDVGSMGVGDQLYVVGMAMAESQAQAYAMGIEIATMVSSMRLNFVATDLPPSPTPEPASLALLGMGLAALALSRARPRRLPPAAAA